MSSSFPAQQNAASLASGTTPYPSVPQITIPASGMTSYPSAVPNPNQVVVPQITIPASLQAMFTPPPPPPVQQAPQAVVEGPKLARVSNGLDGAKAFPTQPNAEYAIFEDNDDVFYFKRTDKNNFPEILRRYRFYEEAEPVPEAPPAYVTMDEYKKLWAEVADLRKQLGLTDDVEPIKSEDMEDQYRKALDEIERLKAENKVLKEDT